MELLAPAGSLASLKAAISAGADAIYLGGKNFNARRNADNFTEEEILEGLDYAHQRGKKVFLTLNTVIKNSEIKTLIDDIKFISKSGFDALILQDLGALEVIKQIAPDLTLHASTQMSAHSVSDCQALKDLGFERVVLARELSHEEILRITSSVDIETEVFIHGALCVSMSGQCYFSSALGERSANRGLCAGVCRLPFSPSSPTNNPLPSQSELSSTCPSTKIAKNSSLQNTKHKSSKESNSPISTENYALSLKDLSYIDDLRILEDLNVTSLKIEGRMKNKEYVFESVSNYRKALDGQEYNKEKLKNLFSRGGFTNSYLHSLSKNYFGVRSENDKRKTQETTATITCDQIKGGREIPLSFHYELKENQPATLTAFDQEGNVVTVVGSSPEKAKNKQLSKDDLEKNLSKLGDTPYNLSSIGGSLDDNLFFPAKEVNNLRRSAIEKLNSIRSNIKIASYNPKELKKLQPTARKVEQTQYISTISDASQFTRELIKLSRHVVIPLFKLNDLEPSLVNANTDKLIVEIPRIYFEDETTIKGALKKAKELGINKGRAHTIGRLKLLKDAQFQIFGGFGLNIINDYSIYLLEKEYCLTSITLSPEIASGALKNICSTSQLNLIGYGHLPLMITRVCPIKESLSCNHCSNNPNENYTAFENDNTHNINNFLVDRKGIAFPVVCQNKKTFEVLNSQPIYLGDRQEEIKNVSTFEFLFTTESPDTCVEILNNFTAKKKMPNVTRGCYFRKID